LNHLVVSVLIFNTGRSFHQCDWRMLSGELCDG